MMSVMSLFENNCINTKYLINSLNLEIIDDNRKIIINTDDHLFLDRIKNDYNIDLSYKWYDDLKSESDIYDVLKTQGQIIAMVDIFNLPYCIYYKKHHEKHSILLNYNMVDDVIEVCDYYYGYFGNLTNEELKLILEESNNTIENGISVYYLRDTENISYDIDYKEVLRKNIDSYYRESNSNKLFGLNSIYKLREHLKKLKMDNFCNNDYLESIYVSVKDVAMYRDGFSSFASIHGSNDLVEICDKCAKEWLILGNLLLMSSVKSTFYDLQDRIINRLDSIIILEKKILELSLVSLG